MFQVLGLNLSLLKPVSIFLLNSIELERHPAICIVFKSVPDQLSDCGPHRFSFFFFFPPPPLFGLIVLTRTPTWLCKVLNISDSQSVPSALVGRSLR